MCWGEAPNHARGASLGGATDGTRGHGLCRGRGHGVLDDGCLGRGSGRCSFLWCRLGLLSHWGEGGDAEVERLQVLPLFDGGHHLLKVVRGDVPLAATAATAGGVLSSDLGAGDVEGVGGGVVVLVVELDGLLVGDGAGAAREIWNFGGIAPFRRPRGHGGCGGGGVGFRDGVAAEGFSIP